MKTEVSIWELDGVTRTWKRERMGKWYLWVTDCDNHRRWEEVTNKEHVKLLEIGFAYAYAREEG